MGEAMTRDEFFDCLKRGGTVVSENGDALFIQKSFEEDDMRLVHDRLYMKNMVAPRGTGWHDSDCTIFNMGPASIYHEWPPKGVADEH